MPCLCPAILWIWCVPCLCHVKCPCSCLCFLDPGTRGYFQATSVMHPLKFGAWCTLSSKSATVISYLWIYILVKHLNNSPTLSLTQSLPFLCPLHLPSPCQSLPHHHLRPCLHYMQQCRRRLHPRCCRTAQLPLTSSIPWRLRTFGGAYCDDPRQGGACGRILVNRGGGALPIFLFVFSFTGVDSEKYSNTFPTYLQWGKSHSFHKCCS